MRRPAPVIKVPKGSTRFGHIRSGEIETLWVKRHSGKRMIHGVATTPTISSNKQSMSSRGCTIRLPVPVFSQHASAADRIGEVVSVRKSAREIYVIAVIDEHGAAADYAWRLIEAGEVRAFSVAAIKGAEIGAIVDGIKFWKRWTLGEVSICRAGANPDAYFEIYNR